MPGYGQNRDIDSGAAEALGTDDENPIRSEIMITGLAGNGSNKVYVGNNNSVSSTNGIELSAGQSIIFPVGWLTPSSGGKVYVTDIFVIGGADNLGVSYWWV